MTQTALDRLLRPAPPRPDRRARRWSEIVRHAVAHPELYPPIRPGEVPSLPLDVHRLRVLAHDPTGAAREIAHALAAERTERTVRVAPATPTPAPPRPRPAPRTDASVARGLAEASGLPLVVATELVRIHGWDLTPAQARHLHRRRTA